ncbi:uncharacterized protein LOC119689109 [Teleopsis dalmanni]|uniref:uncharacterized protein LOC119689109 n=1 Tax=Teleopsis dalmanni TaxID=139649 RepID=UPI0018CE90A4|nr:uncharacterized protein LOC119689109 [Teleopsis dalmanni]
MEDGAQLASEAQQNAEIARVAVKIPPFWRADPALWFKQIESQFVIAGVTQDSTKFHTVVAAMESSVLSKISDIIINTPTSNVYSILKERLISSFSDSEEKRLRRLFSNVEGGDKKPTEILNEMRTLSQGKVSEELLKQLWMQRLPLQVKAILSVSEDNLDKLSVMADKICDTTDVTEMNAYTTQPTLDMQSLEKRIEEL